MAQDPSDPRQSESARQARSSQGERFGTSASGSTSSDRERSIETRREGARAAALRRRAGGLLASTPAPFTLLRHMANDMDRLFQFFATPRALGVGSLLGRFDRDALRGAVLESVWSPQVETFRRGDKLVLRAELPGLTKDDVKIEVDDGMLTISGERIEEHEDTEDEYYQTERSYGRFYRAFPLPEGVNLDQCEATFKDGILEVTVPAPKQAEQKKAKQIPIR